MSHSSLITYREDLIIIQIRTKTPAVLHLQLMTAVKVALSAQLTNNLLSTDEREAMLPLLSLLSALMPTEFDLNAALSG
jgi:hypothetical protein